jgi:predicted alpha-1,6-mannanase (GH76 family)
VSTGTAANAGVLLQDKEMVMSAAQIFDHVWAKAFSNSSKECSGGVWWSNKRTYKNAVTNELVVANAAVLANATGDKRYLQRALAQWRWFNQSGMINQGTGAICDGLSIDKQTFVCSGSGKPSYTYNQGVIVGGLATLFDLTKDDSLLEAAHLIVRGTMYVRPYFPSPL